MGPLRSLPPGGTLRECGSPGRLVSLRQQIEAGYPVCHPSNRESD